MHAQQTRRCAASAGRVRLRYMIRWKWEHFSERFRLRTIWVLLENLQQGVISNSHFIMASNNS